MGATQSYRGEVVVLQDHPLSSGVAPLPERVFIVLVLAVPVDVLVKLVELVAVPIVVASLVVVIRALFVFVQEVVVVGAVVIRRELIPVVWLD